MSQKSKKNTCARVSFLKKGTLAQMFSCEFCKIYESIVFTEDLRATASIRITEKGKCRILQQETARGDVKSS